MAKEEVFQTQGKVVQALANTQFRVKLDTGHVRGLPFFHSAGHPPPTVDGQS